MTTDEKLKVLELAGYTFMQHRADGSWSYCSPGVKFVGYLGFDEKQSIDGINDLYNRYLKGI
jgi:hypothetical protein